MGKATLIAGLGVIVVAVAVWAADETDDVLAIQARIGSYEAAYNQHDAQAVAEHWAEDAVYVQHDTGERIAGRQAIADYFAKAFQADDSAELSVTVKSIRLIPPNVAIEDGTAELTSQGETATSTYTAVHVKQNGVWQLDSVRETETPAPPATEVAEQLDQPTQLDQLAWLVGQWRDEDENATVSTRWEWAKNNRFLTAAFSVSTPNGIELEGIQIIGWDPVAGQLRSWLFDSEGSFGEGVWTQSGNQWTVATTQTLSDGTRGSALNVYTLQDANTFKWRSTQRMLDGIAQPDIDEVAVYRE